MFLTETILILKSTSCYLKFKRGEESQVIKNFKISETD